MGSSQSFLEIDPKRVVKQSKNRECWWQQKGGYGAVVVVQLTEAVGTKTIQTLRQDWEKVAGGMKSEIPLSKFTKLMQHLNEKDLEALFQLYDIDHNNKISFDEYLVTVVVLMDGSLDEKLSLVYNAFDGDRDGSISREEFAHAVHKFSLKGQQDSEFINDVFEECDTDGNGQISYKEFKAFLEKDKTRFTNVCGILAVSVGP